MSYIGPFPILTSAGGTGLSSPGASGNVLTSNGTIWTSSALPSSVTSVTGTANRITVTGTTTPQIDIAATYVGQTSITTLGTITTGTWNGTVIDLAHGGTNANLTASVGGIFYSTASAGAILAGTATAGQIIRSGASAAPSWSTSTYPATNAINTILYASAANVMAALATGNNGVLITSATGVPSFLAGGTTGQVLTATTGSPATWATPATKIGTINGDSGSITGATVTIYANRTGNATGSTVAFVNSSATSTFTLTDGNDNIFLGRVAGNATLTGSSNVGIGAGNFGNLTSGVSNTGVGFSSMVGVTSGVQNSAYGRNSLGAMQTGNGNCAFGFECLVSNTSSTGQNSAYGWRSLNNLVGGSTNLALGISAGSSYTGSESSNILLAHLGTLGESNVMRLGTQGSGVGQVNSCFIAGIVGVTTSNTTMVTINSSTGNMGNVTSVPIANGGTNATSFGTSTGIVKYDGTSLVTSTTAKIDASNRMTNTSQPCFAYYCNAPVTNVSGDGTNYTCLFQTQLFDQGSNFSSNTTFTAPVTGKYQFNLSVLTQNNLATHNPNFRLVINGSTNYVFGNYGGSFVANFLLTGSIVVAMNATDTATVVLQTSNGTKTVGVYGAAGDPRTIFSGFLVC